MLIGNFNYCPDGVNVNSLKATSLICEAQLSFVTHQKYISNCDA